MMLKIFLICALLNFEFQFIDCEQKCVQKFTFAKTCKFYDIVNKNGCYAYSVENCRVIRTTRNEFRCPKYICEEVI